MKKSKTKKLKTIEKQIDLFIDALEEYNKKRPHPRKREDYIYLRSFFKSFIKDQNQRAAEIASKEYARVLELAYKQFPLKTLWNLCIDGRVLAILAHGATARIGSSIRVPGGMLREFIRGQDGKLRLKDDSNFAKLLTGVFTRHQTDTIVEVFDSHVACAARLEEEQLKGRTPGDFGLLADISHKKQIAAATVLFFQQKFGNSKKVLPIQTSFDPHSGFMYMGLETESAYAYAAGSGGYTDDVLKKLIQTGKIISTEELANIPAVAKIFNQYLFPLDWKERYVKSSRLFWERIPALKEKLSPLIEKKLKLVFRRLLLRGKFIEEELDERVMLILTNAFSGYLHNHTVEKEPGHTHYYPYGLHREEGVKVSEGGYPPYNISMFVVFSLEENNLPGSIELATALVRKNRLEGRVKDKSHSFRDTQEFAEASVPVVVQEIVRDNLDTKAWREVSKLDWHDLPKNWEEFSDDEFFNYLLTKGNIQYSLMRRINNLRKRMALLYQPGTATSAHLVEHYKVALPIVVDMYGRNWFIVPFVKLGFS